MSGLLSRCPPLRAQAAHGANQVVCALLCALSACPRWSSALRSCRSPAFPRFPCCAHTWLRPHATVWAFLVFARVVEEQACCGRVCSVGGWGLVFARGACSPFGVCVFWCWRACLGWWGSVVPPPPFAPLACLLACSRSGVGLLACARLLRARWAEGGQVGAGQSCPAPYGVVLGCPAAACAGREALRVGCSPWCANARTQREMGEGGRLRPGECWPGWGRAG